MSKHKIKENLVLAGLTLKRLGVTEFNAVTSATDLSTITNLLKTVAKNPANRIKGYAYKNSMEESSNCNSFFDGYVFKGEMINADTNKTVRWSMRVSVDTQLGVGFELTTQNNYRYADNGANEVLQIITSRDSVEFARYGRQNTEQLSLLVDVSGYITTLGIGDMDEEVEYYTLNHVTTA